MIGDPGPLVFEGQPQPVPRAVIKAFEVRLPSPAVGHRVAPQLAGSRRDPRLVDQAESQLARDFKDLPSQTCKVFRRAHGEGGEEL